MSNKTKYFCLYYQSEIDFKFSLWFRLIPIQSKYPWLLIRFTKHFYLKHSFSLCLIYDMVIKFLLSYFLQCSRIGLHMVVGKVAICLFQTNNCCFFFIEVGYVSHLYKLFKNNLYLPLNVEVLKIYIFII
jgi:hypothetical protein